MSDWVHHNLTTGRVIVRRAASRKLREASDWAEGARDVSGLRRITYNPFRSAVFHYSDTGEEWTGSGRVLVTGGYAYELQS